MLRQFFIYICIRVLPTDLLPTLLMWLWCLNIFTQCQLFFNSSSKFVPFLSKIFIKFQEGISISRQTFPHFNLSDVRRDDDNNAMKEESWIWETGSRINLRLAEVWAEKAEIGKNCWHWFPPLSLQYCEQPINRQDLNWRFPDSFISHIGKSRCLAYQRFRLDFQ